MVKRGRRKRMDRSAARKHHRVARSLRQSALDLSEPAEDGDRYGNAIAIIAIHAAVAYGDALCIAYGGFKSTEGEHQRAAEALDDALGSHGEPQRMKDFRAILDEKDAVAYQGVYYTIADARKVVERLDRFARWAEELYNQRP